MLAGMGVCVLSVVLAAYSLHRHGLKYFFPYLWGDTAQIRQDLLASLRGQMVAPPAQGAGHGRSGPRSGRSAVDGFYRTCLVLALARGLEWGRSSAHAA